MKTNHAKALLASAFLTFRAGACFSQGFMNLNFENAVIVPDPSSPNYPYAVYASNAIPGWTAYIGAAPQGDIIFNTISLGATSISILGTNGVPSSLDGAFSINLYGGTTATSASISQTGLVPVGAASIQFIAQYSGPPGGTLLVSLGGQNIPLSALSIEPNYTLYGGNVSANFAGQTEQLALSAPQGANNYWTIDDILFSNQPIPEPSVFGLLALGVLIFGRRVIDRRR